MSMQTQTEALQAGGLPSYQSILLAADSSDHSNRGAREAAELAHRFNGSLTATHVYAAKLHDIRFRQMEGGLPEQFREEEELERQRDVHDSLISKGLSIITDSYLDQVEGFAREFTLPVQRCSLEGKNYRQLVKEANKGKYDLLVLGALGLGAVKGSRLGTVCQRVTRRSQIDTLVIKDPQRTISAGPIVVGIDGSAKSYGGLLTALSLAQRWGVEIKVVSAFDPYYHYVAFNRIAGVLSEEAGKVFKFQEQEQLHEEIIDSGLAKIYQGHLAVAQSIASDFGFEIETVLLDGKPHDVILRYLQQTNPSLLILGMTGIHADPQLDIGGNTEYLLNDAACSVLLSQRQHKPQIDRLASVTTSWTREAEARMERVPSFVRGMAKMAILRYAQEKGHTVITESIVEEATARLMPGHAERAMDEIVTAYDRGELKSKPRKSEALRWSENATRRLLEIKDLSLRGNLSMRAEKKARATGADQVKEEHIAEFLNPSQTSDHSSRSRPPRPETVQNSTSEPLQWQAAALARLMRVPEGFMRDSSKQRIEHYARTRGVTSVSFDIAEAGLTEARKAMESAMGEQTASAQGNESQSACPFTRYSAKSSASRTAQSVNKPALRWNDEANALVETVPPGFCRQMTIKATETMATNTGIHHIDADFVSRVLLTFKTGSNSVEESLPWAPAAHERIQKAPETVRGMLIKEIETWARDQQLEQVTERAVDTVKQLWIQRGVFHLDAADPRNA